MTRNESIEAEALRQMQAELEASRARYMDLYDRAPVGYVTLDEQGIILEANLTLAGMLGVTREEMVTRPFTLFIWPDDLENCEHHYWELFTIGTSQACELRLRHANGRAFWVHLEATPAQTDSGALTGRVVVSDITRRKEAETAVQHSERRLKEAEAMAHFGYYEFHILSGEIIWSDETFRIFGRDPADGPPTLEQFATLIHPEDVAEILSQYAASLHMGRSLDLVYRLCRPDGEVRTVHTIATIATNANGRLVRVFGTLHDITEQKRSEIALRQSENRFRALVENAPNAFVLLKSTGVLGYVNPAALTMMGYEAVEVIDQDMARFMHPEDVTAVITLLLNLMQHPGQVITTQYRFLHKDGSWRWLENTISNLLHEPGIEAILFNFRDITRRLQVEQTVRQQSEHIRLLYDASQRLNRTLDLEEIYQTVFDFLSATVPCDALIISAFDPATELITCHAYWTGDGLRQDVSNFPPIPLEPEGMGTQSRVIRTGQSLLLNDYQTQRNTAQNVYYFNDETNEIIVDIPPDADVTRSALIVPLKVGQQVSGVIQVMSYRLNAYTETQLNLLEALSLHINSAQKNARLYAQIQNELNERKQAEYALRESHQRLEETLAELQQTQAQLVQQERLAAVGQLAAGIAHDFNNILAIISLYVEMALLTPDLQADLYNHLLTIGYQTKRATHLVEQILDFGRRAVLQFHALDLVSFVQEQIELWQRTIPESIQIDFHVETPGCVVNADRTRLQQMLTNLVLNARDAMPGGGELRLVLRQILAKDSFAFPRPEMAGRDWAQLIISDSGDGIAPAVLAHIFEPFFTTKKPGKGSGLGLAQVYGIVKQHHGYVDVQSTPGQGTTFTICLPSLAETMPVKTAVLPPTLAPGHNETILIVEDNVSLREALASILLMLDYQVLEAGNGREALALLEKYLTQEATDSPIALVLSDLVMPEMGGQALLQAVRQQGWTMPFVILSGHPLENELEMLQAEGLTDWLLKPPGMPELAALIAKALQEPIEK